MMHTTVLPLFSGFFSISIDASTDAPELMPTISPSSAASRRAIPIASSPEICTTSSNKEMSALSGTNPAPIPWILCGPALPPESTALSTGSTATNLSSGLSGLRYCAQPVSVPPVPTPPTKMSKLPLVSAHTSGPVVSRWTLGLSGLANCCSMYALSFFTISSALAMAPFMPFAAGVSTSFAPNALSITRRSRLIDAGIVRVMSYPLAAATIASAIPVLPDVGSTSFVTPGLMSPRFSASAIMEYPIRSFTLLHGSIDSSFARIVPSTPAVTRFSRTSGVPPMSSVTSPATRLPASSVAIAIDTREEPVASREPWKASPSRASVSMVGT
mmetsp:Transcript_16919/g.43747  ORF Transcript_16919/g.43747 Transcript_16919/m.43747 type:complete len:329 (-) Transcript_16919:35-1021(-)